MTTKRCQRSEGLLVIFRIPSFGCDHLLNGAGRKRRSNETIPEHSHASSVRRLAGELFVAHLARSPASESTIFTFLFHLWIGGGITTGYDEGQCYPEPRMLLVIHLWYDQRWDPTRPCHDGPSGLQFPTDSLSDRHPGRLSMGEGLDEVEQARKPVFDSRFRRLNPVRPRQFWTKSRLSKTPSRWLSH